MFQSEIAEGWAPALQRITPQVRVPELNRS